MNNMSFEEFCGRVVARWNSSQNTSKTTKNHVMNNTDIKEIFSGQKINSPSGSVLTFKTPEEVADILLGFAMDGE